MKGNFVDVSINPRGLFEPVWWPHEANPTAKLDFQPIMFDTNLKDLMQEWCIASLHSCTFISLTLDESTGICDVAPSTQRPWALSVLSLY